MLCEMIYALFLKIWLKKKQNVIYLFILSFHMVLKTET